MPSRKDDSYTDPELRAEVKDEIQAGDKAGAPGQWSARKAQMMTSEYKKLEGGHTTDKKDEGAKHLDQWTEEECQTKDGSGHAKNGRYRCSVPSSKKAWEQMSEKEADVQKQQARKEGKQHVANTSTAAKARKNASKDGETNASENIKINKKSVTDCTTQWDDPDHMERNQAEYKKFLEQNRNAKSTPQDDHQGKKRGRGANANVASPKKKQKSNGGGRRDEPIGAAGDKTRVPKKGQKVQWHSLPGYINGEVVEVVYEEMEVDGKSVKASKEDPRVVLKSGSSGKICVHKPEAVYFD
ncbi:hypothetical protein EJ02DRAFT_352694 [Clathrospora elynae]|uniref:Hypervirulence associated protein TUDOR domain-containing protein n=1 Tax=Clathrospora elynae TaxID=706981 RepID=A0A6A5SL33_9PLEO|nr:hypothetical protein EJ02DRAFT_352694 [Clathrospora elynae]